MSDAKSSSEPSIDEILSTIRRIISEDEQAPANTPAAGRASEAAGPVAATTLVAAAEPPGGATEQRAADANDILELTEAINEDGTTRHLAPIGGGALQRAALRAAAGVGGAGPAQDAAAAPPQPAAATASVRDAAALLPRDMPVGAGQRTLEDIVRETLRPLLQAWLDENLPPLVERLVQAEVAKSRPAGGGD